MKANRSARAQSIANANAKPRANQNKRTMGIVAVGVVTFLLILWVFAMSQNATKTVQVAMYAKNIYKNQQITADMFIPYDMLQSEYDNFASTYKDGTTKRKVILYSEVNTLVGTYAAYPLRAETYALWTDFFTSTKLPSLTLSQTSTPPLKCAQGPILQFFPILFLPSM